MRTNKLNDEAPSSLAQRLCTLASAAMALAVLSAGFSAGILRAEEPMKVTEEQAREAATSKQPPEYPAMARQMRITGKATIEATIDAQGKVEACQPVTGNPILTNAAVTAVKKWAFKPFTDNGKPTKAVARISFNFGTAKE